MIIINSLRRSTGRKVSLATVIFHLGVRTILATLIKVIVYNFLMLEKSIDQNIFRGAGNSSVFSIARGQRGNEGKHSALLTVQALKIVLLPNSVFNVLRVYNLYITKGFRAIMQ